MSLKDKLQIRAWIGGAFLIVGGWFHFFTTRQQRASLDALFRRWRADHTARPHNL